MRPDRLVSSITGSRGTAMLVGVIAAASLSGCAINTSTDMTAPVASPARTESSRRPGRHVAALDFTVASVVSPNSATTTTRPARAAEPDGASSPEEAVRGFMTSLLAGDGDQAWSLVDAADRARLNVPARMTGDVAAYGWSSFTMQRSVGPDIVVRVVQRPRISDIDGVIAANATLRVPTVQHGGRWFVRWTQRDVVQQYPERSDASDHDVLAAAQSWAIAQQGCAAARRDDAGLLGVVGLASALCGTSDRPRFGEVGDLDALDDPQPILDAFGGSALRWARVVPMRAPVPMAIVIAPNGDAWTVIGVARASLTTAGAVAATTAPAGTT